MGHRSGSNKTNTGRPRQADRLAALLRESPPQAPSEAAASRLEGWRRSPSILRLIAGLDSAMASVGDRSRLPLADVIEHVVTGLVDHGITDPDGAWTKRAQDLKCQALERSVEDATTALHEHAVLVRHVIDLAFLTGFARGEAHAEKDHVDLRHRVAVLETQLENERMVEARAGSFEQQARRLVADLCGQPITEVAWSWERCVHGLEKFRAALVLVGETFHFAGKRERVRRDDAAHATLRRDLARADVRPALAREHVEQKRRELAEGAAPGGGRLEFADESDVDPDAPIPYRLAYDRNDRAPGEPHEPGRRFPVEDIDPDHYDHYGEDYDGEVDDGDLPF